MKFSMFGYRVLIKQERVSGNTGGDRLSEDRLISVLAMSEDAPVWRALMQVIEDHADDQVMMLARVELADKPGALAYLAGGVEVLRTLKDALKSFRERGLDTVQK